MTISLTHNEPLEHPRRRPLYFRDTATAGGRHGQPIPPQAPTVFDYSPYIEQAGLYERIVAAPGKVPLRATFETNRGCPYSCTYCDWATTRKLRPFDMSRVEAEVDWLGRMAVPCFPRRLINEPMRFIVMSGKTSQSYMRQQNSPNEFEGLRQISPLPASRLSSTMPRQKA